MNIQTWLTEKDPKKLAQLWQMADTTRQTNVGDAVHLRGLIEISNNCIRKCAYCGISALNTPPRYRMNTAEIMNCVTKAVEFGYGTVVMQAGEDYALTTKWIAGLVKRIKTETPLAVTLSLGERPLQELEDWREAGADRYLLRFETSDPKLYQQIHPGSNDRITTLKQLKQLDYEIGSGVMIGIPGQTYVSLANDIQLFAELDLDMVGVGPYIPHPETPLGSGQIKPEIAINEQVPNNEEMTYKVVALTRLACHTANIPSTTALATINKMNGRELGLTRGANVVMPNLTPPKYREQYTIYPDKACINETAEQCQNCLRGRIAAIGREIGTGAGNRKTSSL
ncbi:MAG: [FeFe] hydrogenase H-cluster radical SAM maturase HydE [Gammaproteobacteria bacterium]|nr:[FeFe] hydrogenase H-cluster radical SAM maturase HydE [Gammaproteobacteria bacterium]